MNEIPSEEMKYSRLSSRVKTPGYVPLHVLRVFISSVAWKEAGRERRGGVTDPSAVPGTG